MLFPYFAEVPYSPATTGKAVALVHPGSTLTSPYHFRAFDVVGSSNAIVPLRITRHATKATGGVASTAYSFVDGAPAAGAQVLDYTASFPVGTPNFSTLAYAATRASGGGIVFPAANNSITLLPDHTLVLETIDIDPSGMYTIRVFWGEPAPMLPHLTTTLPAAGAYTAGTYLEIPVGLSQLTFAGTYTAANPSSGARPKMRVSWGRGASTGFVQPIRSSTLDLSVLPIATRETYLDELIYSTSVAQGVTVQFAVAYDVLPGMNRARLDVAELGATATPGSVVVGVTGS